ncbi:mechanosensitive ion channel family protein [Candidatus Woesearchaeota archaeon]|nr:mechanosensitive ion channel family protein [Candidatus Woesearchaeota archaeon]
MNWQEIYNAVYSNPYLQAAVIFIGFIILSKLFVFVSKNIFLKITKQTKTKVDDLIVHATNKPISLLLIFIGAHLAIIPLGVQEKILSVIRSTLSSFIVIIVAHMTIRVFDILIDAWGKGWAEKTKSRIDDQLIVLIHRFSKIIFAILAFLFVLDLWGIKIGPLLASLGIAGIAVAFALQNTLGNIFGGISMILDKTVRVGDVIQIDDKTMGTVMDIGLRSTKIRTFNNETVIIPNGELASSKVDNYAPPDPSARVVLPFNVAYGSDVDKVKKIVLKEIDKIEGTIKRDKDKKPFVRFIEMADSSLKFKAFFWMKDYMKRWKAEDDANTLIYKALNRNKISIPFPQMDVHLKKK